MGRWHRGTQSRLRSQHQNRCQEEVTGQNNVTPEYYFPKGMTYSLLFLLGRIIPECTCYTSFRERR